MRVHKIYAYRLRREVSSSAAFSWRKEQLEEFS